MNTKETKRATLLDDEFNPHKAFRSFWRIPRQIAELENLSLGAKLLYSVLAGLAGEYGTSYPSRAKLQKIFGGPSPKTIYNWQRELVKAGLIRVHQKGRGLTNNYYFLRTPILNNAEEWEFEEGERCVYRGPQVKKPIVVTVDIAKQFFKEDVDSWVQKRIDGYNDQFPKPSWQYDRKGYRKFKEEWEAKIEAYFDSI